eukprot:2621673-Prymnesium_polylepis.1
MVRLAAEARQREQAQAQVPHRSAPHERAGEPVANLVRHSKLHHLAPCTDRVASEQCEAKTVPTAPGRDAHVQRSGEHPDQRCQAVVACELRQLRVRLQHLAAARRVPLARIFVLALLSLHRKAHEKKLAAAQARRDYRTHRSPLRFDLHFLPAAHAVRHRHLQHVGLARPRRWCLRHKRSDLKRQKLCACLRRVADPLKWLRDVAARTALLGQRRAASRVHGEEGGHIADATAHHNPAVIRSAVRRHLGHVQGAPIAQ